MNITYGIEYYEREFEYAMTFRKKIRAYKLANIMSDMERNFNIPMVTSPEFNQNHEDLIDLYLRISKARNL